MKYLSDPRREDPRAAMPGARSGIVCLLNYNTDRPLSTDAKLRAQEGDPRGWTSRYAWGDDYHEVLKERLQGLIALLRERFPDPFEARAYVDTGPVQERVLAKYAGLGWLGKNTLLLNQALGSYFFLGVILTTLDLEPTLGREMPPPDLCGSCQRCLEACPTQAFVEPYVMDARKCISYLTIELRGSIPDELREPMANHVFGCDICQDVCPWNRRAPVSPLVQFQPRDLPPHQEALPCTAAARAEEDSLFLPRLDWLLTLSEAEFREVFRGSPLKRTKWSGLVRNACIAAGNAGRWPGVASYARILASLQNLATCEDSIVAESAQWALSRIQ